MKIDNAIDKLNAAYKRLDEPQGRLARKNARKAFLDALKALRKGLDDEYPNIRKPVTHRKKRNASRAHRGKVLIRAVTANGLMLAGVRRSQLAPGPTPANGKVWAPEWMAHAIKAGIDPALIAQAVRSRKKRRQIASMVRLGK